MPARPAGFAIAISMVVGCGRGERRQDPVPTPPPGVRADAVIDSHVHLALLPVADELARAGVAAAVDMGAPLGSRAIEAGALALVRATPLLTRVGGYPINAWDPGGFGFGCDDEVCATTLLVRFKLDGGKLVKIALGPDGLDPALLERVIFDAHGRGMKVAVHALGDNEAFLAGKAGADVLAHTPVEPLSEATVEAWKGPGRAVVSTLAAFGGTASTVDNLRALRAAGLTVLYGTDLGNTQVAGVNLEEMRLLREAGLDGPAIVAAMTTAPAAYWNVRFPDDTYVRLDGDPGEDPASYGAPIEVWIAGKRVR